MGSLMEYATTMAEWLDGERLDDHADVYQLYLAVRDCKKEGLWICEYLGDEQWVISYGIGGLLLDSVKSRQRFLEQLERDYCEGMDMESWFARRQRATRDDGVP